MLTLLYCATNCDRRRRKKQHRFVTGTKGPVKFKAFVCGNPTVSEDNKQFEILSGEGTRLEQEILDMLICAPYLNVHFSIHINNGGSRRSLVKFNYMQICCSVSHLFIDLKIVFVSTSVYHL